MEFIGNAKILFDKYKDHIYTQLERECESQMIRKEMNRCIDLAPEVYSDIDRKRIRNAYNIWFSCRNVARELRDKEQMVLRIAEERMAFAEATQSVFRVIWKNEYVLLLTLGATGSDWMIGTEFADVTLFRDLGALSGTERLAIISGRESGDIDREQLTAMNNLSAKDAANQREETIERIKEAQQEIKDIQDAKTGELAEIRKAIEEQQAALEAKKRELEAIVASKKAELEAKLEELEETIFRLDSELYMIRSITGEIVQFAQLRSGKQAARNCPLILMQKIRYLDEEMAKLSMYGFDFSDVKLFEDVLKKHPMALELFAPYDRCVTLVRVSRTGLNFSSAQQQANILEAHEKYRGNVIGIILRDGDNLYLGWTDEDRIDFKDDMFFRPGTSEAAPETAQKTFESDSEYAERMKRMNKAERKKSLGRLFVFSVLQGCINRGMILFPAAVNVMQPSEYVVWSYADRSLEDHRFGTFQDVVDKCNSRVGKGDMILTLLNLRASYSHNNYQYGHKWENDRGRGEKNRTHDVHAQDNHLYAINMVEELFDVEVKTSESEPRTYYSQTASEMESLKNRLQRHGYTIEVFEPKNRSEKYYVSLPKAYSEVARANFEIATSEFWNMTYANTIWLSYLLTSAEKLGNRFRVGGMSVDYSHMIPYINTAMDFLHKRELRESTALAGVGINVDLYPEWQVTLSEWKLETGVRSIENERTAKRFARYLTKENAI